MPVIAHMVRVFVFHPWFLFRVGVDSDLDVFRAGYLDVSFGAGNPDGLACGTLLTSMSEVDLDGEDVTVSLHLDVFHVISL